MTRANVRQLQAYEWSGNVRELQNVVERALIVSKGSRLQFDLPTGDKIPGTDPTETLAVEPSLGLPYSETERLARDRANIVAALRLTNGRISGVEGAAELLGIKPTTLASRMKTLGISRTSKSSG